jgi:hypothetical protein
LAEELRRLSEQDDSVTPMHAVPEAPRNNRLSDDQCCEDGLKISYLVENRLLRENPQIPVPFRRIGVKNVT